VFSFPEPPLAFFLTHTSGSLILRGTCKATQQGNVVVSDTIPDPPSGNSLREVMTALSSKDPTLTWVIDSTGQMRVSDKRANLDILHIRLKRVAFRDASDPNTAIRDILAAPEFQEYLKEHRIQEGTVFTNVVPSGTRGIPRFSELLNDVTVEQALDRILQFFPGLWVYSECTDGSLERFSIKGFEVRPPGTLHSSQEKAK